MYYLQEYMAEPTPLTSLVLVLCIYHSKRDLPHQCTFKGSAAGKYKAAMQSLLIHFQLVVP